MDTVELAAKSPEDQQPWAELGLKDDEYARIREILGRRPTTAELAMYSVMWSEHCSYKSSKVHLRRFGDLPQSDALLVGMGENAGVVDVGDGWAVTFKVESHNHPSYVEPYQGAATGVGGIVRDILTMGARPVAVMDSLRFGAADAPDTARVLPGVVAGVGGYGNCLGLPNIGGELLFDDCYAGNPLVNALCVGVMKHSDVRLAKAEGAGNKVVLFGARTGGDGIGGVSVLASETFDDSADGRRGPAKRPAVQVGDPFTEKLLIEACLEIFAADLVTGIQDLGGAGISCATSELAAAGSGGMAIDLDAVPLRDSTLTPAEILMSESQERMCAIVEPGKVEEFLAVCARWDVLATVIGEVTDGDRLTIDWHGERIVDVPPRTVALEGPVYERPMSRPADLDALQADAPPSSSADLRADWLAVVSSPDGADKTWVTEQYDRYVRGNTVLAQPEDAGVLRIDEQSNRGIALALDGNARYARLDPYTGTQLNLAEAYRNVAVSGARPLAVTNCLNFGSPEEPEVMWQFAEAVRGLADGCRALGLPVTGGNVSLYNQTGETAINPTPVIGVLGVHADVTRRVPTGWRADGETVLLLGETRPEFGGSAWAGVVHGHLGGLPPALDLAAEQALAELMVGLAADGLVSSAHDLADGGLAQALTECALRYGIGAQLRVEGDPTAALFAESGARAVVTTADATAVRAAAEAAGVPVTELGTTGGAALALDGLLELPLAELREAWTATLPALFGSPEIAVGTVPAGTVPTS
ncbi:phosphoribosylformylglycinamidine synthase subunit PurL [Modestobacter altitudinis]|uniref:phosphoribosylformylglycinamidine synthase subunit PurL n=1 Tax=Modestobacter altitudinis TaxID=2213158 RepID=UPI00110CCFE1|nr:phosphoribosylformylglycinamidine synthase subunit PurL [Modestobacter altitudinis]